MIKEQNLILSGQKEKKSLDIRQHAQEQPMEIHVPEEPEQNAQPIEDTVEEQNEPLDDDNLVNDHDGRELEVQLEEENLLTSNEQGNVLEEDEQPM